MASVPPRPASALRPRSLWLLVGLSALGAACLGLGRLLPAYFVGDDFAFIGRYATFPVAEWPGLFTRSWQLGLFAVDLREIRPLNALAFMVDGRLWGAAPFGFRLTNLLLHAGSAALVGALAWELTRARRAAVFATLVFALHPVAIPAAGWITGRVDVLSTLFLLGAALAQLRYRLRPEAGAGALAALGLCFAAALFTKESALVFPGLMLVLDLAAGRPGSGLRRWSPYLVAAGALAAYAACRQAAFGVAGPAGVGRGATLTPDAPLLLDLAGRQARYAAHLLPPLADWIARWRDAGFPRHGLDFFRVATAAAASAAALAAGWSWLRRPAAAEIRRRLLALGLGWYLVTTLPLIVTYFSARHLYPAAVGLALAVALLAHELLPRRRPFALAAAATALLLAVLQQAALEPWMRAAERSRAFAQAVETVARDATPGTIVFLDAPDLVDGAFCWSWTVPHALRPPFVPADLARRLVPVARPAAFAYREDWRAQLPRAALAQNRRDAHLLHLRADGTVADAIIPAARVPRFLAVITAAQSPDDATLWADALADLQAQSAP